MLKQTVSKKTLTRPVNNGCGEDLYVSHASVKQNFGGHRKDCAIQDGACLTNGTFGILDIFTKREKKMYLFLALYALKAREG